MACRRSSVRARSAPLHGTRKPLEVCGFSFAQGIGEARRAIFAAARERRGWSETSLVYCEGEPVAGANAGVPCVTVTGSGSGGIPRPVRYWFWVASSWAIAP